MTETTLSLALRKLFAGSAACSAALLALPAQAQQTTTEPIQRVEITGSSIKRLAAQTALPITSVRAEDFAKQGLATAQEVLATIPMNQTSTSGSQSVGAGTGGRSVADLRGLGGDKTLVLLNGRRLANHPFFADTVDLNIIPIAALDRVEILRDGASAIYGTDAIGGVVNFITKRSYKGMGITAEAYVPTASGGGDEARLNFTGGWGDLNADGWNVLGVVDYHRQAALRAADRPFSSTGVRPERGVIQTSGTPFPANFFSENGISGNPSYATGCLPPGSIPNSDPTNPTCRFDFTRYIDNIPLTSQQTFLGRFSKKFGDEHTASLEYLHSRSNNEAAVSPPPLANIGLTMYGSSPFYPGAGITPAVAGLTGEPLDISWRPLVTGNRVTYDVSMSDRVLASMEGSMAGWDYNTGLSHSVGRARSAFTGGYVIDQRIIEGVGAGILNPFGEQTPEGTAFLGNSLLAGRFLRARINSSAFDFKASRDLREMGGGQLGFAIGGELRHDKATYTVNRELAGQASSSGFADAQDQRGSRTIRAIFSEVNMPFSKALEVNLAGRYDYYTDVGGNFSPKIGVRFQPAQQVLLRGSYNTGFRAPTLYDIYGPQTVTNTAEPWDDPVLCPGGTAVAGANPNVVCNQQQNIRQGGNQEVEPEESRTYTAGIVLEPTRNLTLSADYWDIKLEDQISALAEQTLFGNYPKYSNLFVYNAANTRLEYVQATTTNLGEIRTRGVDLSLLWRLPQNPWGNFSLAIDGTWVQKYDYQNEPGGPFTENAGRYADASPVFRWRHNATLSWSSRPWTITLSNRYLSGYTDQNAVEQQFQQRVDHYSIWSLAGTYSGNPSVDVTAGVKNLLDDDPPYTNQTTTFQQGYDPRYTDPLGRTFYVRATYKF
ncbi:TonB-dependent receptor [Massilia sp. CF038]|uniref:TonB-dependent receptor n=1 Tax=Massilia sp. CF038 TaxID=1881045 RepID=UPI000910BF04|nr:TonB-dependent receptor [Massilia sp. CF038]SHH21453.1 iron complex outermembrane recepter protein [Massilia sp. CF038]